MTKKPKLVDALSPLDAITSILAGLLLTFLTVGTLASIGRRLRHHDLRHGPQGRDLHRAQLPTSRTTRTCLRRWARRRGHSAWHDGLQQHDQRLRPQSRLPRQWRSPGVTQIPTTVVFVGFLLLTRRTIKYARRNGLFSPELAARGSSDSGGFCSSDSIGAGPRSSGLADGFLPQRTS